MPALTLADRVAETTTTTGTGTLSLGGIVGGAFRTFVAGAGTGAVVPYVIVHRTANEWEVGYGTVTDATPDTLSRTAVYSSSNANALVNFSAGTKDVFLSVPASRMVGLTTDPYLRLPSGSLGIQFNGDTAAANALDDYEEGTWTPAYNNAGSPSYSVQYGRYTKIGRLVYCTISLYASSVSGAGFIEITGLPFTPTDVDDTAQRTAYNPVLGGHLSGLLEPTARFRVTSGATSLTGVKGNTATTFLTAAQFTGGDPQITGAFWYFV